MRTSKGRSVKKGVRERDGSEGGWGGREVRQTYSEEGVREGWGRKEEGGGRGLGKEGDREV